MLKDRVCMSQNMMNVVDVVDIHDLMLQALEKMRFNSFAQ